MCRVHPEVVEQADHIAGQIVEQIPGLGAQPRGSAAVAVVEAHDPEPFVDQSVDETRVPPEPRSVGSGEEHDGVAPVTRDVDPQIEVAHPHELASVDVSRRVGHRNER